MQNNQLPSYFFDFEQNPLLRNIKNSKFAWELLSLKDVYFENLKRNIKGNIHKSVCINGKVTVGKGTVIEPFSVIQGPVIIGDNCYIRSHVQIRPGTIISSNVTVGHGVEIKNSFISEECKIDSLSFVGDSIFGIAVRNGSATVTANRGFDQKNISCKINNEKFATSLDKFGCIIGDYSRIGANCTTAPGTLIGKHVWVYPNVFIQGFIESNKLIKYKQETEIVDKEPIILKRLDNNNNI